LELLSITRIWEGVVTLKSDDHTYADSIELAAFNVDDVAGLDEYLKVTFDNILSAHTSPDPLKSPLVKITITRPDATTTETYFNVEETWTSYESLMTETFKVDQAGEYSIKLDFEQSAGPSQWTTAEFQIKNFMITKIANVAEGEDMSNVVMDEYYLQETGAGFERLKVKTLLADVDQVTEVGGLLLEESAGEKVTELWRTYGNTEDIRLLDIYARNILTNRYSFKNMLKQVKIHDRGNTLDFNTILTIDSRNYTFVSYSRDFRYCEITGDLMELLTTQPSALVYGDIQRSGLTSVDGQNAVASPNVNLITPGTTPAHNDLTGLNVADMQHLTDTHHTDLTDGGNCSIHKHDDRYYTEAEIDTWRNSVTQTEMGYLHGATPITSNVQAQITARAVISGTPADNQLAVWTGATDVEGESRLQFGSGLFKIYSNEAGKTDWRLTFNTADADLAKIYNYDEGESARMNMVLGDGADSLFIDIANERVGINDATPSYSLDVNGTGRFTGAVNIEGLLTCGGDLDPATDRVRNMGSFAAMWDNLFIDNIYMSHSSNSVAVGKAIRFYNYAEDTSQGQIGFRGGSDGNLEYMFIGKTTTDTCAVFYPDGAVELYHNDSKKLETTAAGITVTGVTTTNGAIIPSGDIETNNYVSETTGWKGTYAGAFDVRSLYTDELIAKTFIADIDLALLSGTMVSKSITQVSRNFTVPAIDNTSILYVEALPGFPTSQAFESGDWVRLQVIDRTGGGLTWLKVYGQVTNFVDDGDGEQHWTYTTKYCGLAGAAEGETVYAGASAQDLGTSGDGYIQSEAGSYSLNTPYIQTATWVTNPYEGANITVRTRLGNLTGITNQSGFGFVTRKDNDNYVTQWWTADDDWGIKGAVGGNTMFQLGDTNKIACLTIESTKLYIGTGTYGNTNTSFYVDDSGQFSLKDKLTWDGTDLAITGTIHATAGDIGGFTIDETDGLYSGTGATRVQMKAGAGFWTGATAIGDAPFSVTNAGVLKATSGTIGGFTISSTALTGGAAGTTVALTPGTGIHMGAAVFGDAPFSVTNAGVLAAESGTIGGWTLASDAFYTGSKHTGADFSTTGITLASDGSIHTPNLYVNVGNEIGFRAEKLLKAYTGLSDDSIINHATPGNSNDTNWELIDTITLGANVKSGRTLRIKFWLAISDGAKTAYGGIWKNGDSVGAEQSTQSTSPVEKSQDIADWDAGDAIQLKLRTSDVAAQASATDFRVCGTQASIEFEITEV